VRGSGCNSPDLLGTALALEIASTSRQAAKELAPVKDLIDTITNFLGKAKEIMDEKLRLPGPKSQERIEPPTPEKQLPPPRRATWMMRFHFDKARPRSTADLGLLG
jgi:hypothetical protein